MWAPSQWPRIGSGWACKPILANEMEEEVSAGRLWGKGFLASKETIWQEERCPSLLALKMITSGCDAWTCGSHSGAMRRAHVEPSLQLKVADKENGNLTTQDPPGAADCLMPRALPTLVMGNIQSYYFSHCQSGSCCLQPKSFLIFF